MDLPELVIVPVEKFVHNSGMLIGKNFLEVLDLTSQIVLILWLMTVPQLLRLLDFDLIGTDARVILNHIQGLLFHQPQ